MSVQVLALDLERTLIDNALSARPRPGLSAFLAFCHERFRRVAVFTTVEESDAREVLCDLAARGHVPPDLLVRLEYIAWSGEYKDLAFVPGVDPAEVVLVDDDPGWVRQDQRCQWIPIAAWESGPDGELPRVRTELEHRLADRTSGR
jgi:NLI interacting factor-like phosphatase